MDSFIADNFWTFLFLYLCAGFGNATYQLNRLEAKGDITKKDHDNGFTGAIFTACVFFWPASLMYYAVKYYVRTLEEA